MLEPPSPAQRVAAVKNARVKALEAADVSMASEGRGSFSVVGHAAKQTTNQVFHKANH